jgi:hypothetical protein
MEVFGFAVETCFFPFLTYSHFHLSTLQLFCENRASRGSHKIVGVIQARSAVGALLIEDMNGFARSIDYFLQNHSCLSSMPPALYCDRQTLSFLFCSVCVS